MLKLSEPEVIEHAPYHVVGLYAPFDDDDEGPGWSDASEALERRKHEIRNRTDDKTLGFLYRPHRDHPEIPESVRTCFVGVDVTDFDNIPDGMSTTQFSGGTYAVVRCTGDSSHEAAMGVGKAIHGLYGWLDENGYAEGDACFACSDEHANHPPFVETVYMKIEAKS